MAKNDNDSGNNDTNDNDTGSSWPQNGGSYSDGADDASDWVRASVADTLSKATDLLKRGLVTPAQFDNLVAELGRILDGVPADDGDDDDDDDDADQSGSYDEDTKNYGKQKGKYSDESDTDDDNDARYSYSRS